MLAREQIECDVLDVGGTYLASSRHVSGRTAIPDDADEIARELVRRAPEYDRVLLCNEHLIGRVMRLHGEDADHALPAPRATLEALVNKTRFSPFASERGLPVPEFEVATTPWVASQAAGRLGGEGRIVVKGRWGAGGSAVRMPETYAEVRQAAEDFGCPVLVERLIKGELVNMPCLYERGKLVAAMVSRKLALEFANGPSAVNAFFVPDERLRVLAEKAGDVFGLHGFTSADVILTKAGDVVLLEINPRVVAQLHLGHRMGVDMGRAFADVIAGRWDGVPRYATRDLTVHLFPQDLRRYRRRWGAVAGTLRWARHPRSWDDVPWGDARLLGYEVGSLGRNGSVQPAHAIE